VQFLERETQNYSVAVDRRLAAPKEEITTHKQRGLLRSAFSVRADRPSTMLVLSRAADPAEI
jgi:hypothetical protein